jgi:hypothetical protein
MHTRIGSALTALAVFLAAGSLWAHHGYAVVFDVSKTVKVTGTFAKLAWTNPHIELSLDAKSDRGQLEAWVVEAASPGFFRSRKVGKSDFANAIGQTVTVEVYRARDGTLSGSLLKITFPDGKSVTSTPGQ